MEYIDFGKLKELIDLYRETENKSILEKIIFMHNQYINDYISKHEVKELEKDEVISIIVLSIIDIVKYVDLNRGFDIYKQQLKRTIKKDIYEEVFKIRYHLDKESYNYYASQHKNGENGSYVDDLFENYLQNIESNVIQKELETFTKTDKFIINSLFELSGYEKLTVEEISEILKLSCEEVLKRKNTVIKCLKYPVHNLEY